MNRRPKKRNIKTTEKILIICEGETEEQYTKNLLKEFKLLTNNINFHNLKSGSYQGAENYLKKNSQVINIALFIMDLDRCTSVQNEKKKLKSLIKTLEKINIKNNIFLTYNNFENWVAASINKNINELTGLHYKKGNGVFKFITQNEGSFYNGKKYFENKKLYYEKKEFKKGVYNENFIKSEQSSLYYFLEYMELLLSKS